MMRVDGQESKDAVEIFQLKPPEWLPKVHKQANLGMVILELSSSPDTDSFRVPWIPTPTATAGGGYFIRE
jgi:hypothetical protein